MSSLRHGSSWFTAVACAIAGLAGRSSAEAPAAGVAVIETFTSEGCSSCPPADAALADLLRDVRGQRVFALAFHVDYWDSQAWRDQFSSAAFTARQNAYARRMKLDSIYTPQTIVNGTREFVGSNRATLKESVAAALATPAAGAIVATRGKPAADGATSVDVDANDLPPGTIVNVALVQSGVSLAVRGGENGGRTLTHDRVVRSFVTTTLGADHSAHASLAAATGVAGASPTIVVYAQRPADAAVVAAAEVTLAP